LPEARIMIRDVDGLPTPVPARPTRTQADSLQAEGETPLAEDGPVEKPGLPMLSPRMRIEASLNLVVLEFRDADGTMTKSIPTLREIDAYRSGSREPPGSSLAVDVKG